MAGLTSRTSKRRLTMGVCRQDMSFTCTLFAPTADFAQLSEPSNALSWFKSEFPDALPLIGEQGVLDSFRNNPRSPLIAIKVRPRLL